MKRLRVAVGLIVSLAGPSPAQAQSADAILRCDPGTVVEKVDGVGGRRKWPAGHGFYFKECAIPLTPGSHTLEVCYDLSTNYAGMFRWEVVCPEKREVPVDAQAGRTYRLKLDFRPEWKAWVEDVTEAEAGLSYDPPPPKTKPTGSKKDLESTIVLRVTPENILLSLQKGIVRGKWFKEGGISALKILNFSGKGVPDGTALFRARAGDTFAWVAGQIMGGSAFKLEYVRACGDFPVRLYDDVPAGKVLYAGHIKLDRVPGGYVATFIDDIDETRAYLDAKYPDLAGRLEPMAFREVRTPHVCIGTGYDIFAAAGAGDAR